MAGPILKGKDWTPINKGFGEYFFEQAEKIGDEIFQIDGDTGNQQTYKEISQQATRTAIYLKSLGIKEKDVVLLCAKNSPSDIVAVLAALYLGAYVSGLDGFCGSILERKYLINIVEPKLVFVPNDQIELMEQSITELPNKPLIISIGDAKGKYTDMLQIKKSDEEKTFRPFPQKGSDTCVIVFSSGSSSLPKGICMSNTTLLSGSLALVHHNHITVGCLLSFSPLNRISAWIVTGAVIMTGTKIVTSTKQPNGELCLKLVDKYKATFLFSMIPLLYSIIALDEDYIKKYDTSSLVVYALGGSTIDPNYILKARKYLPHTKVNLRYSSTEAMTMTAHDCKRKEVPEKISSSGIAIPGVQIKVVDLDTEKALGPNEKGEIRTLSKYITNGFYKLNTKDFFDEDGWLKTGDEGYYDHDGYIYVTDRISSMFKHLPYGQVSPSFLEFAILQHPKVAAAVAFGVPHKVDVNHPAACVVLKPGVTATVEEIMDFLDSKVTDRYRPKAGLMILDKIPMLSEGKYDRRLVKENFMKNKQLNRI